MSRPPAVPHERPPLGTDIEFESIKGALDWCESGRQASLVDAEITRDARDALRSLENRIYTQRKVLQRILRGVLGKPTLDHTDTEEVRESVEAALMYLDYTRHVG